MEACQQFVKAISLQAYASSNLQKLGKFELPTKANAGVVRASIVAFQLKASYRDRCELFKPFLTKW